MPPDPLKLAHARALIRVIADEKLNDDRKINVQKSYDNDTATLAARGAVYTADKQAMMGFLGVTDADLTATDEHGNKTSLLPQAAAAAVWKKLFPDDPAPNVEPG